MRLSKTLCLGMLLLLTGAASANRAEARGGEDWPFRCVIPHGTDGGVDAFQLTADNRSATGYAMHIYQGNTELGYIVAEVQDSQDPRYYFITGHQRIGALGVQNRQIVAFVAKDSTLPSTGDSQITWGGIGTEFHMQPLSCGGK